MAKKYCVVCGKDLGFLSLKTAISDGYACSDCLNHAGISTLSNGQTFNAKSLNELLDSRRPMVNLYAPTKKIGTHMTIDENNKLFKIGSDIFEYTNLLSFELLEDGHTVTKGGLGRAVAGGLLFGGVGAIVGGLTGGKKSKGVCNSMKLRVTLKNAHVDNTYISFITSETKTNGFMYKSAQTDAQSCISALEIIVDKNQNAMLEESVGQHTISAADEIIKFKQLLDAGVITQDEFDAKKKQLLGI